MVLPQAAPAVAPPIAAPAPAPALAERLRSLALSYCNHESRVLTCDFEPGGRTHGVGVISDLWCRHCGHPRMWHDVALAAAVVEREARPPLFREDL